MNNTQLKTTAITFVFDLSKMNILAMVVSILLVLICFPVHAGSGEQAKRIHDRIAGVPPSAAVLSQMTSLIDSGNSIGAANVAIENSSFYNVTLKNWVTPWTNLDQNQYEPLNDYTATVIGMVRDNLDFRQVLYGDILYVGNFPGLPVYSNANNAHYESLDDQDVDLNTYLERRTQSSVTGLPSDATAGIMTTRAAAKAFFSAGTNRAMFRFNLINYMCRDLEQVKDLTGSPDRIQQDVTRSPGGDSRIFLNNCISCHTGMDPMNQAFAYYDYVFDMDNDPEGDLGSLSYNTEGVVDPDTGSRVKRKYRINPNNFVTGYVTRDDSWINYWRTGTNQWMGWDSSLPGQGNGAKSMGMEMAHSELFAECQVEKVFEAVCLRPPSDAADRNQVSQMVATFKSGGYNIKTPFAESAVYCMGD